MEGIFFILVASALFSHAWYLLGLYTDGRMMGTIVGACAVGMLVLLTFTPQLVGTEGTELSKLGQITVMKSIMIAWAVYALAVAAHGIWELDDRAIGFYAIPLIAVTAVGLSYFASIGPRYYDIGVWLSLTVVFSLLTICGAVLFFYLAVPFRVLRLVTAGTFLGFSPFIAAIGFVVTATAIS